MNEKLSLFAGRSIDLKKTNVMGIINVTDDSFYSSSRTNDAKVALERALNMVEEGADIIDIGAESTRPGSGGMDEETELQRLIPAVVMIRAALPRMPISVDTRKAAVAEEAIRCGADIINDVSGLELEEERAAMASLLAASKAAYVLMHTKGTPDIMHVNPDYTDFHNEIISFFYEKIKFLNGQGVDRSRIVVDPGIGFGKRLGDNLHILGNLEMFRKFDCPLLIGASRKGFIGKILDTADPADRLEGTLAVSAVCAYNNVEIVRVHDVIENVRTIKMANAIGGSRCGDSGSGTRF